jgi:hypothetical protein
MSITDDEYAKVVELTAAQWEDAIDAKDAETALFEASEKLPEFATAEAAHKKAADSVDTVMAYFSELSGKADTDPEEFSRQITESIAEWAAANGKSEKLQPAIEAAAKRIELAKKMLAYSDLLANATEHAEYDNQLSESSLN